MTTLTKEIVQIPTPITTMVPISMGTRYGNLVFVSGNAALDMATGQPIAGDIRAQTRRTLENIRTVLEAGGSSLECVLKCNCYLTDIDGFSAFNEVYQEFFPHEPPARTTVGVKLAIPVLLVEIEAIAHIP